VEGGPTNSFLDLEEVDLVDVERCFAFSQRVRGKRGSQCCAASPYIRGNGCSGEPRVGPKRHPIKRTRESWLEEERWKAGNGEGSVGPLQVVTNINTTSFNGNSEKRRRLAAARPNRADPDTPIKGRRAYGKIGSHWEQENFAQAFAKNGH